MQSVPITVKILPQINPIDLEGLSASGYNKTLSTETKKLENKIVKALKELEENTSSE
jgi:hypothetical protein